MARRPIHTHRLRRVGAIVLSAGLVTGLVATVGVATVAAVSGATITVTTFLDSAPTDDGECSIQEAVASAEADAAPFSGGNECAAGSGADTIVFAGSDVQSITLGAELVTSTDVVVDGGSRITLSGNSAVRAFHATGGTLVLRRLAIQGGHAFGGGGVFGEAAASLVLDNVSVTGSSATIGGGLGAYGPLTITNSTFAVNSASDVAGGLFANGGATISNSTFLSNTAVTAGAIESESGTIVISGSTFSGNDAGTGAGGAIYSEGGAVQVDTSTFTGNTAASGGAIRMANSSLTLTRSTLDHNTATGDGGAIYATVPLTITNSTIANNSATGKGGGIYRTAELTLTHSTIALNTSGTAAGGGGIANGQSAVLPSIANSVVAGNSNGDYADALPNQLSQPGVATNSQVGLGANTLSQLLDPAGLQSNGGPTRTIKPVASSTNPLLGAADATICAAAPTGAKDQRGYGRATPCDIGAVELDRTRPVLSNVKLSLREGVALSGSSSRVRLSWSTNEKESGVKSYRILRSVNGGSFTTYVASQTTGSLDLTLTNGKSYAYKVRAVDREGNTGAYVASPTITPRLVQQTSSAVAFKGTWTTKTLSSYSGGSARYATANGASVSITATGRSFAFVTTTGRSRGAAKVYLDGSLLETIDLYRDAATAYRVQVWSKTFASSRSHTVRIVVLGTAGRPRVDADAFVVLR